jgi:hypothetical protein
MSELFATLNDQRATSLRLVVPNVGSWYADVDLDTKVDLSGRATLKMGAVTFKGTIFDVFSGTFGLATKARLVGGANGWASDVVAKHYHNDAGVKSSTILTDAAREVGESLDASKITDRIGVDYVRKAGPASRVLEQILGVTPWWVDYDGITRCGARPEVEIVGTYDLLIFNQKDQLATIATDDPGQIRIGSVIRERLDAPAVVRALEITMDAGALRINAWCGGGDKAHSRIGRALRSIAREATNKTAFHGLYRFRVVQMNGTRVDLQAVRKQAGLPDTLPVDVWPGMAGLFSSQLTPGALVLVAFIEGEPSAPIISHFEPKGGGGFLPINLLIDATTLLELGPSAAGVAIAGGVEPFRAARKTDPVQAGPFVGFITEGSLKTRIG